MSFKGTLTIHKIRKDLNIEKIIIKNFSNNDWGLLLYPEEELESKSLNFNPGDDGVKLLMIKTGSVIFKEPRLFSKNCGSILLNGIPHIEGNSTGDCLGLIINRNNKNWISAELIENWAKEQPFSVLACCWLMDLYAGKQEWMKCISEGKKFLFVNNKNIEDNANINYKIAYASLMLNDKQQCIENIIFCLSINPSFAEGWCLLGDVFALNNQFKRSVIFYKNAISSGKMRNFHDRMLIMSEKYENHPNKMIKELSNF